MSKMNCKYKLVVGRVSDDMKFSDEVSAMLNDGWRLHGECKIVQGVEISSQKLSKHYCIVEHFRVRILLLCL